MEPKPLDVKKKIQLSEAEKSTMREAVMAHMQTHPIGPVPSPWQRLYSFPSVMALGALFLCIGVSGAAAGAVPGSLLYPIKRHINEPVRLLLSPSSESRARIAWSFAEERVIETRALETKGALTEESAERLQKDFDTHVAAASSYEREAGVSVEVAMHLRTEQAPLTPKEIYSLMLMTKTAEPEAASTTAPIYGATKPVPTATAIIKSAEETALTITAAVASTSSSSPELVDTLSDSLSEIVSTPETETKTKSKSSSSQDGDENELASTEEDESSSSEEDSDESASASIVETAAETVTDTVIDTVDAVVPAKKGVLPSL